jgi:hypothetical protein
LLGTFKSYFVYLGALPTFLSPLAFMKLDY